MSTVAPVRAAARKGGSADGLAHLGEALRAALAETAGRHGPGLVSAVVPVDGTDPVALFAAAETLGLRRSLWLQPSADFALVGLGEAWSRRAAGRGRFEDIAVSWSALARDAAIRAVPDAPRGSGPLLIGGLGFSDTPARSPVWRGFGSAEVVLPALLLTVTADGAWLTASLVAPSGDTSVGIVADLVTMWSEAARLAGRRVEPAVRAPLRLSASRPAPAEWRASVSRLAGAVGRGRLDKVVLARQVDVLSRSAIEVPSVLARLRASATESTVFAIAHAGRTFLGASPERLVSLDGLRFTSVAMAGSTQRGADPAADAVLAAELLASDKEREEHAVVVDMLRATLAPLIDRLEIPATPHVEPLRHLQHLVTHVDGQLSEALDILRLASLLHPTPAVGGMPRDLALQLIGEEETIERGWYAGPLGWVDRAGDGELIVALRSGVLEGSVATLMAGCGIVADSDPEREWQESTTKLLALGSALGRVEL